MGVPQHLRFSVNGRAATVLDYLCYDDFQHETTDQLLDSAMLWRDAPPVGSGVEWLFLSLPGLGSRFLWLVKI